MSPWHLLLGKRFRLYSYSSGMTWAFAHFPRWLKTAGTGARFRATWAVAADRWLDCRRGQTVTNGPSRQHMGSNYAELPHHSAILVFEDVAVEHKRGGSRCRLIEPNGNFRTSVYQNGILPAAVAA